MLRTKIIFAALALTAMTSLVIGADKTRIGGNGFLIEMTPTPSSGSNGVAVADCRIRVNQNDVVMLWTTTPFRHLQQPELESDAVISANVTSVLGAVNISPSSVVASTRVQNDQDEASIAMGIMGNGQANVNLQIAIKGDQVAAGTHCATVVLTVTGR